ncbi:hypothetical protein [Pectobacterium sp. B2J-2]|uniref:hypothetical protein n=1 Tax=Pectobacterium sp. B2J-2 TaxID=3385372 RepID=UPI0038FCFC2E
MFPFISKLMVRRIHPAVSPSLLTKYGCIMASFSGLKEDHDHANVTCYLTRSGPHIVDDGAILIDIRQPEEYAREHIA